MIPPAVSTVADKNLPVRPPRAVHSRGIICGGGCIGKVDGFDTAVAPDEDSVGTAAGISVHAAARRQNL